MRILFAVALSASMCDSPSHPTVYDAGEASCAEAWKVADGCHGFEINGPDELPDSGDEVPWINWCESFQSSGIEKIDTWCIAKADGCETAFSCLDH